MPKSDLDETQRRPTKPRADDEGTAPSRSIDRERQTDPSRSRSAPPAAQPARPSAPRSVDPERRTVPSRARPMPKETLPEDEPLPEETAAAAPPPRARAAKRAPIGAIPAAPRREKTATEIVLDKAKRDWRWTAGSVGGAVGCGFFGIYLIGAGHMVFGGISLVLAIPFTLAALFVRRAPCPKCGRPTVVMDIDQCDGCGSFLYLENEQVKVVEPGFIADVPTFELKVPLPIVERLIWPDEKQCVVCGGPAGGNQETLDVQGVMIPIPHCGDHEQGVAWSLGMSSDAVTMVGFRFRSYDYFQKMKDVNAGHLKAGMWRGSKGR